MPYKCFTELDLSLIHTIFTKFLPYWIDNNILFINFKTLSLMTCM